MVYNAVNAARWFRRRVGQRIVTQGQLFLAERQAELIQAVKQLSFRDAADLLSHVLSRMYALRAACDRGQHRTLVDGEPADHGGCVNVDRICVDCGRVVSTVSYTAETWRRMGTR